MKRQPLHNRNDAARLLLDLIRPLKAHYSEGHAWLHVGDTGVHYGEKVSRMEGFARVLWGLGPLWAGEEGLDAGIRQEAGEWRAWYLEGIIHGTDPESPEYWGMVADYDQKMVEMAALATAFSLSPTKLWERLTSVQQGNLFCWLNQINQREVHANNWRYFRILVNMMFQLLGLPWPRECMEQDQSVIEGCYTGDGWYYDGNAGQVDYYIPFAMHFYGLVFAKLMGARKRGCCELKTRAAEFAEDFTYWFAEDGTEIPYGRSLTYRFAHGAFFSALGFAGAGGIDPGMARYLALRNLERWMECPIFDQEGILTIGYGYPNLFMSERYNGPGSPYWGLKTFLMLAIPDTDPFWTAKEQVPSYERKRLLSHPHMLITHDSNHHVMAFPAGQHCRNHGHCAEKYEKFVYSNQFGFSVSREDGLREGAFDNTLAVSAAGDHHYRMRYGVSAYEVTEQAAKMRYRLMPGVAVESVVIPCAPWHVRVHKLVTEFAVDVADGGFSIEADCCFGVAAGTGSGKYTEEQIFREEHGIFAVMPWGVSGVRSLSGGDGILVDCFPNTNLLYNLTVLPTICRRLEAGEHWIITAVLGDRSLDAARWIKLAPEVRIDEGEIRVDFLGNTIKEIFFSE